MNTPQDLNKILFEQLNTIKGAAPHDLKKEIDRGAAICDLAEQVIANNQTIVDYTRVCVQGGATIKDTIHPNLLK